MAREREAALDSRDTTLRRKAGERASVLIVDDREEGLLALEETVKGLCRVVRARSGQEALRLAFDQDFAVILLDVRMPEMDGFETAELIRRRPRTRDTPIILITAGDATPEQTARGYAVGAVDYIFKPYAPEVLKAKVSVFLELFRKSEELRLSEQRFRTLLRNIPGAVYRRDARVPWKVHFVSDRIEEICGHDPAEFLMRGKTYEQIVLPEERAGVTQEVERALRDRQPYTLEYRIQTRDGQVRWVRDKGQGIGPDGEAAAVADGVLFDITERRHVDDAMRERTEELAEANRRLQQEIADRRRAEEERNLMTAELLQGQKLQAIGQLAAGIAHEINNPTAYILSNVRSLLAHIEGLERFVAGVKAAGSRKTEISELLRTTNAEFLLQDFTAALRDSEQGAEKIRDIVTGLREFAHRDPREVKTVDLREVLEGAIRIAWNEIKYRAEIVRDFGPVPAVPCYPLQIEQVFINLLLNAAQAIETKGEIRIATFVDGGHAVVRIHDTGCGIPSENLGRLFEPFFTTKPVGKGTGLGLHVAYKIVSGHGGRIDVKSAAGEGTEFTVRLPLATPV